MAGDNEKYQNHEYRDEDKHCLSIFVIAYLGSIKIEGSRRLRKDLSTYVRPLI